MGKRAKIAAETPAAVITMPRLVLVQRNGLKPRRSPAGKATNDLIVSAHQSDNSELFPQILSLYVPKGSRVADTTYGRGVFWRQVPERDYILAKSDLKHGVDCRDLPYPDESLDCVVFDPPYMHTPGGSAHHGHQNFESYYKNNGTGTKQARSTMRLFWTCTSPPRRRPAAS